MPKKFDFSSWDDLKDLITQEESVVLKKVSGANGDQVYLLNNLTFDKMKSSLLEDSLSNYIAQETLGLTNNGNLSLKELPQAFRKRPPQDFDKIMQGGANFLTAFSGKSWISKFRSPNHC